MQPKLHQRVEIFQEPLDDLKRNSGALPVCPCAGLRTHEVAREDRIRAQSYQAVALSSSAVRTTRASIVAALRCRFRLGASSPICACARNLMAHTAKQVAVGAAHNAVGAAQADGRLDISVAKIKLRGYSMKLGLGKGCSHAGCDVGPLQASHS